MTRWQRFFLEDDRLPHIPPSHCAKSAVEVFSEHGKRVILDLVCGAGRDAFVLAENGLSVVGLDMAESGLNIAAGLQQDKRKRVILLRADARHLPFADGSVDGVYSFGLLHEFTAETREGDVHDVMQEVHRVLKPDGIIVLTVLSGEPEKGLPHVCLFTEEMFDRAIEGFRVMDKREYADLGCTGCDNYQVWRGVLVK